MHQGAGLWRSVWGSDCAHCLLKTSLRSWYSGGTEERSGGSGAETGEELADAMAKCRQHEWYSN